MYQLLLINTETDVCLRLPLDLQQVMALAVGQETNVSRCVMIWATQEHWYTNQPKCLKCNQLLATPFKTCENCESKDKEYAFAHRVPIPNDDPQP